MSGFIDRPRFTCALGGAVGTVQALPRAVGIVHGPAGCGGNINMALNAGAGCLGGGYCGGNALPSSNVVEQDVVFGGEERLREQIQATLEIVDADLYVVVTGCVVDMIGDDTAGVAAEFARAGKPVIGVPTPSFKGNAFAGYDMLLCGLIEQFVERREKKDALTVNLLGIVPAQDVFWKGNLRELKRLLGLLGLRVNTFFGEGETLDNLRGAAAAALNIVVSDNAGLESARRFEAVHGVPFLVTPFPIGAIAGERFLREAGERLGIDAKKVDAAAAGERAVYYDYLSRAADIYNDADLQRYAVVVGDSNYAPAITRFVSDELGWFPELVMVTDGLDDERRAAVAARFAGLNSGLEPLVRFDANASALKKYLREAWPRNRNSRYYDGMSPAVIFGSTFEREAAAEFGFPLIPVSFPLTGRCVMNRAYAGFRGGLSFTEDALSFLVAAR
ncbi:MAG: nitrogenase molybdenum-iron protein beta chain [Treponematales bacterium]